ncbi:MAG: metallophosphoesterase, partial [Paludibacteraceae bacterium]|nr:metallophosphoesterase [Paludibacteraceae bacterium]
MIFFIVDVWTLIFKTKVLKWIAVGLTAWGFLSCMYGMMFGRFNISAKRVTVENKSLPHNFDGYKILQISDLHLSSFHGDEKVVSEWVDMMNAENPDIICLTGDIVAVFADEMLPYMEDLKRLKAKDCKYAILGNHDYGDYHRWKSEEEKEAHNERLKSLVRSAGFDLLLDEYRLLTKGGDTLAVVGLENRGKSPREDKNGNLERAEAGLNVDTRLLLS